ncbi:MAG: hypothetical protein ABIQ16_19770 [Polyangiaceae bacterium]
MPVLVQALARLVALKRLGVLLFVLVATLCATNTASAHERVQIKTRIRDFELAEHHSYGLSISSSPRKASGKSRYRCPNSYRIHSYRWRDPSGRFAGPEWWYVAAANPEAALAASFAGGFALGAAIAPYTSEKLADLINNNKDEEEADLAKWQKENADAIAKAAANKKGCPTDASGGGAKGPPPAKGDVAADDDGPRGFSDKQRKAAERALRTDKNFRRWFHREYKGSEGTPDGSRTNPDLSSDQVSEAYEEWLALGKGGR